MHIIRNSFGYVVTYQNQKVMSSNLTFAIETVVKEARATQLTGSCGGH